MKGAWPCAHCHRRRCRRRCAAVGGGASIHVLKQYERGVQFRLGQLRRRARPGLIVSSSRSSIVMHRVSLRIVTMPIQSQGIITRDNVSVDVSAVAYFRVVDAVKSVVAIENVDARDQPDRPDDAAQGGRPAHPGRDARRDRQDQPEHPRDPRRADRGLGRRGHAGGAEGHPAARQHEARDGASRPRPSARSAPRSSPPRARRSPPARWATRRT